MLMSSIMIVLLHVHVAPSSGPESLSAVATSSSSIVIMWDPPMVMHRNGLITGYIAIVQRVEGQPRADPGPHALYTTQTSLAVGEGQLSVEVLGLEEGVRYSFMVMAQNRAGLGPHSAPVTKFTIEKGRHHALSRLQMIER
jgi:hypothetical protein